MNRRTYLFLLSILLIVNFSCKAQNGTKGQVPPKEATMTLDKNQVHTVFQNIAKEIWINQKVDLAYLSRLPKPKQVIYATYLLEMDVNNGGFYQFFNKHQLQLSEQLPLFLEILGAHEHKSIMIEANKYYLSPKEGALDLAGLRKLDRKFYKASVNQDILKLQAVYIQAHEEVFR